MQQWGHSYLSTSLALVRFLASVHPLVHRESRSLDELLPTVWVVADMWSDTTVDSLMSSKVTASGKGLPARAARIRFWRLCWIVRGSVDDTVREHWWHARKTHWCLPHLAHLRLAHLGLCLRLVHLSLCHLRLAHLSLRLAHLSLRLGHLRLAHVSVLYGDHSYIHGSRGRI
jgi:hypothetical protein